MKSELKFKLYEKLKEEFYAATCLDEYGCFEIEFEIDEDYSHDLVCCDVAIIDTSLDETINLRLCIYKDESMKIEGPNGDWNSWNSFDGYLIQNLWRQLFFEALRLRMK